MALVVKDRVKQTTTTTGTGSVVLNGTVSGFQTFAAALSNGDTTYYAIFEPSTNEYEVGLGTWTESSATLARTTVLESSNSGSAVSLTAQAEVFITQPAEKAVYLDASNNVTLSNNLTVSGDFTVSGTTTTIDTTNSVVTDSLVELSNGTSGSPSNDAGIVIERGSSDNAFIGYDESADKFTVGTGSFTGASTGNLTISTGTLVANVEGNVTGNVTGNVSGSSGSSTGNAATATALQNARTIAGQSFDGTGDITIAPTDLTGVNSTAAELNILDGVTSTNTELNLLDGVTATTTELNYVDGVTSAIQTQLDAKAPINNPTFTGSISHAGDLTIDVGGVIALDANNGVTQVKNNGNQYGTIYNSGNNFYVQSNISDGDLIFQGNDGGSGITALTLDMSDAGTATFNHDIKLPDSGKAIFGAGSDLQIYHDGFNSKIVDSGSGSLMINATDFYLINSGNTANFFRAIDGAQVDLYHNGSIKLTTTSTGIDVTGTVTADGLTVDTNTLHVDATNNRVGVGTSAPNQKVEISDTSTADVALRMTNNDGNLEIQKYQDDLAIKLNDTGDIIIRSGSPSLLQHMRIANNGDISFYEDTGTTAKFYWDASAESLGIGTSSPSRDLYISGGSGSRADVQLSYDALGTSSVDGVQLGIQASGGYIWNFENSSLYFATNNAERLRITSDGSVGIGTTAVNGKVDIANSDQTNGVTLSLTNSYQGSGWASGDIIGKIDFRTDDTSTTEPIRGQIKVFEDTATNGTYPPYNAMSFSTGNVNTLSERLRIDSSGNVGINKSTIPNTSSSGYKSLVISNEVASKSSRFVAMGAASAYTSYSALTSGTHTGSTFYSPALIYTDTMRFLSAPLNNEPDDTNLTERMRLTTTGLGIGSSSPEKLLHLSSTAPILMFEETDVSQKFSIGSGGGNFFVYDETDSRQALTIDGSGNLLVGKTSAGYATDGFEARASGYAAVSDSGATPFLVNRNTDNGSLIDFYKSGAAVGSIGTSSSDLHIGTGDTGLSFNDGDDAVMPVNATTGFSRDNAIDLGYSSIRFKDLYLSGSLSDGSTSRTVADIVGLTSSQFLRSDAADAATGTITVASGSSPAIIAKSDDWGEQLEIIRNHATNWPSVKFSTTAGEKGRVFVDTSNNYLMYVKGGTSNYETVWTSLTDGSGSGLDADLLDGQHGSYYIDTSGTNQTKTGAFTTNSYLSAVQGVYSSNWFRFYGEEGLYSQDYGQHFYADSGGFYWESDGPIRIRDGHEGTVQGYLGYHDGNGFGLLNASTWWLNTPGDNKYLAIGGSNANNPYDSVTGVRLMFGSANSDAIGNYYIGTNLENWNSSGNYNKLDIDYTTGIRIKARASYGGTRFYDSLNDALLLSVGTGDTDVAVANALTAGGDITAYYSDERLKDFEGKIDGALDKVSKLNGYYFRENDKAKELGYDNDALQVGVSAQEVEAVMPEVVKPAPVDPEYKTVQYEKLIPLLIEAIKELKEEVRQLKEDKA